MQAKITRKDGPFFGPHGPLAYIRFPKGFRLISMKIFRRLGLVVSVSFQLDEVKGQVGNLPPPAAQVAFHFASAYGFILASDYNSLESYLSFHHGGVIP